MRTALFVTYGGGHVTMVAPVVKELQAHGVECHVIALTTGYQKAKQLGLHPLGYRDFQHLVPNLSDALAWGQRIYQDNQHPDVDASESLAYLGINFGQWVHDHGETQALSLYATQGRMGFYPLNFMRMVLQAVNPDVVVTTNSPRSEQAAIEAAIGLSIPTLSMVDLFLGASDPFCQRRLYADKLTVISGYVKQVLESIGIAASQVVVTGNPAFDTLASETVRQQARDFRQGLGWADFKVVMFAGHTEDVPETPLCWRGRRFGMEVESRLRDWACGRDGAALIVRYHPSESHLYPEYAKHPRIHRSDPSLEPLHPVLLSADTVVVQTSTVGLEASLSGRSVLCMKFAPSVQATSYNYADLGLAAPINSFDHLISTLNSDLPLQFANPVDYHVGRAATEVCTQILKLMRG